jgi:two-component system, NtrC family, nitrogen regulation sensor histidine kinase GlnL
MKHNANAINYNFTVDNRLRINSWSEELERIFRKTSYEVQGIPYYQIIPKINKDGKDAVIQALRNCKSITVKGCRISCYYGGAQADIRISPLKDRTGKIKGVNISIKACPSCIICEQLKQSERFIDIGKISATFAHGVRSPLNAIKGAVVYLREKYTSEKKLIEFTEIIEEEISRLDNFIAKFLSTTISDQGLSRTDLESVLKKIKVITSLQAQSCKVKTIFKSGYCLPVMMNAFHLEHAILNVINNAIDAMPSGGTLAVITKSEVESGIKFAVIEISDTGCGIMKSSNGEIIMPSRNKGKGLGLFLTREILHSCGGHLEIKSKRGLGSTIKLYIPAR